MPFRCQAGLGSEVLQNSLDPTSQILPQFLYGAVIGGSNPVVPQTQGFGEFIVPAIIQHTLKQDEPLPGCQAGQGLQKRNVFLL